MSKRSRLEKAEQRAGGSELPFLPLWQSLEDESLFHTTSRFGPEKDKGEVYTQEQIDELAETHMIFKICYDKNWRGVEA